MPDSYPKFKAAVVQLAPSFLNREKTVEIACKTLQRIFSNFVRKYI